MEQPTVKIQETFKRTVVKTLIWRVIAILTTIILAVLLYNDLQKAAMNSLLNNNKGYEEKPVYFGGIGQPKENPWEMNIKDKKEDLTWLLV